MRALLLVAILVVYACAQAVSNNAPPPGATDGGCCFYREKNFQGEIGCASRSFRSSVPIQSFFCTDGYAGNIVKDGQITAPVLCGDSLPETLSPIPVDEIHVFTPCPRFSDCCFYTEENGRGDEFCVPSNRPPQLGRRFKSYTCLAGWKPRLSTGGADLPCPQAGVNVNFAADKTVLQEHIDTAPCDPPQRAESIEGDSFFGLEGDQSNFAVEEEQTNFAAEEDQSNFAFEEEQTNFAAEEDQSNFAVEEDQSNFAVDADQSNFAVDNVAQEDPLQVTSETENLAVATEDASALAFADDEAASANIEEADFIEVATESDAAMAAGGSSQTLKSGSSMLGSMIITLLVGVVTLLLA